MGIKRITQTESSKYWGRIQGYETNTPFKVEELTKSTTKAGTWAAATTRTTWTEEKTRWVIQAFKIKGRYDSSTFRNTRKSTYTKTTKD